MANISTDNINTIAQEATSIKDGDYIYIFKATANTLARIEKSVFMQGAGSVDENVYAAIRTNIDTLRLKINDLINAVNGMANYAFINTKPSIAEIGEMTWPDGEGGGDLLPSLISPSGLIDFGTLAASAQTMQKSVYIKGSNLTNPLTLAITAGGGTSGGFTLATTIVSAEDANTGTNVIISYTRDNSDTAYSDSGTLTITSQDNVGGTFGLSIYVDAEGSVTPDPGEDTDYIQDNLLLHLDGKSQGGQSGKWVDRTIRQKEFTLFGNPSVGANGITFNTEGQYALCLDTDLLGSLGYADCTIEICFTADNSFGADGYYNPFFVTNVEDKIACIYGYSSNSYKHFDFRTRRTPATSDVSWKVNGFTPTAGSLYRVSMNKTALVVNGEQIGENNTSGIAPVPSKDANYPMMVGGRVGASTTRVAHATIHEVRIYNSILTVAQMQANQAEDLTRYGTGNS